MSSKVIYHNHLLFLCGNVKYKQIDSDFKSPHRWENGVPAARTDDNRKRKKIKPGR